MKLTGRWVAAACALAVAVLGAGCADRPSDHLRVFAASSLTEVMEELLVASGVAAELHCEGTQRLIFQLEEGAVADLLVSADAFQMMAARQKELLDGEPRLFAGNQLVVAVPAGNPRQLQSLEDLSRSDLRVALCAPEVPAGRYARQLLTAHGLAVESCSDEPSVRSLAAKLRLGEIDAAIIYATDLRAAGGAIASLPLRFPEVAVEYHWARLRTARASEASTRLIAFLESPEAHSILRSHGFVAP